MAPTTPTSAYFRGDRGSVRFSYEPVWLKMAHAFPLDPELDLTAGEFYPGNANFGVFMDSCPDYDISAAEHLFQPLCLENRS